MNQQGYRSDVSPVRQWLFVFLLAGMGGLIFWKLSGFISALLGAITLYAVLRYPLFFLTEREKWPRWATALGLLLLTILALVGVGWFVFVIVAPEIASIDIHYISNELLELSQKINDLVGFPVVSTQLIVDSKGLIATIVSLLLNSTYSVVINLVMMVLVLYFMLIGGRAMERMLLLYMPFDGNHLLMLKSEIKKIILSNAIGIPLIMIVQGIVSGIGYWIAGLDRVVFWAFLTAIFGLIPIVGTAAAWLPLSIYLLSTNHIGSGIFLLIYSVVLVTNSAYGCQLALMKMMANVHPLIVIFGVILGIPLFGFWGIIFGPLLISCFLLLLKIYKMEYGQATS
ncbi:MAG: AI-2E family transporter [Bacteroidales bacterium]|jgi:predicted PurR-regulated permease PerM|nr:AI-2E family transporter [Bacteroidales bacterium]